MIKDTPTALARACAESMWADDHASQHLGMEITHVGPGEATLAMNVAGFMVNGHGIVHGGYIFTLADSAFAFACNSYNQRAVAQHCSITFLRPVHVGDRLTATARETIRSGRSGIYDVRVVDRLGDTVAEFRGHARTVTGTHVPEKPGAQGAENPPTRS